jgi:hypothetical protein
MIHLTQKYLKQKEKEKEKEKKKKKKEPDYFFLCLVIVKLSGFFYFLVVNRMKLKYRSFISYFSLFIVSYSQLFHL